MKQKELRTELAKIHDRMTSAYDEVALGLSTLDGYADVDAIDEEDDLPSKLTKAEIKELVEELEDRLECIDNYLYQAGKRLAKVKDLAEQLD